MSLQRLRQVKVLCLEQERALVLVVRIQLLQVEALIAAMPRRHRPGTPVAWEQAGGTWSTFGGAIDGGETPWHAAVRETSEEIDGIDVRLGVVAAELEVPCDHGCGWTYTTFAVRIQNTQASYLPTAQVASGHAAWETAGLAWVPPSKSPTIPAFTRGCAPPGRRYETSSAEVAK